MSDHDPEVVVSRPIPPKGEDPAFDEMLRNAVAPNMKPWDGTAADVLADLRAAVDKILTAPVIPMEQPFVISPVHYKKAQDLLGVHDRPLTNDDLWEAAYKEVEEAGLDPFTEIAKIHAQMYGGWFQ